MDDTRLINKILTSSPYKKIFEAGLARKTLLPGKDVNKKSKKKFNENNLSFVP